jgi:hypothetical protein
MKGRRAGAPRRTRKGARGACVELAWALALVLVPRKRVVLPLLTPAPDPLLGVCALVLLFFTLLLKCGRGA